MYTYRNRRRMFIKYWYLIENFFHIVLMTHEDIITVIRQGTLLFL